MAPRTFSQLRTPVMRRSAWLIGWTAPFQEAIQESVSRRDRNRQTLTDLQRLFWIDAIRPEQRCHADLVTRSNRRQRITLFHLVGDGFFLVRLLVRRGGAASGYAQLLARKNGPLFVNAVHLRDGLTRRAITLGYGSERLAGTDDVKLRHRRLVRVIPIFGIDLDARSARQHELVTHGLTHVVGRHPLEALELGLERIGIATPQLANTQILRFAQIRAQLLEPMMHEAAFGHVEPIAA